MLINDGDTINDAVRQCFSDIDFRSAERKSILAPNLYNGIFDYSCPSDLDAYKIIDIPAQAKRSDGDFFLIPSEEFDIKKPIGSISIDDFNGTRVLKINSVVNSNSLTIAELDSLVSGSSDGTEWQSFGDAESLNRDSDDYIKGAGAIKFNISSAGGTTAGIQHSAINSFDITEYLGGTSSFFLWVKINSITNLTNYTLRFGTSSSNYYSKTVTTQADGTSFINGWNLLKFDISSYSTVGTPTNTDIKYFAIFMTKTSGKVSESDYKFDWLTIKKGVISNVKYYTKYGWNTSAGAYIENSTTGTDLLVCDKDEYGIILEKAVEIAAGEVRENGASTEAERKYLEKKKEYIMRNPSKAKIFTSEYYSY